MGARRRSCDCSGATTSPERGRGRPGPHATFSPPASIRSPPQAFEREPRTIVAPPLIRSARPWWSLVQSDRQICNRLGAEAYLWALSELNGRYPTWVFGSEQLVGMTEEVDMKLLAVADPSTE